MNTTISFILIGKPTGAKELEITNKPSFYDAIQLSNQSLQRPHLHPNSPYHLIPLEDNTDLSFHYGNANIEVNYDQRSLSFVEVGQKLMEEEVFDVLANFVVKEGNKASYLGIPPYGKDPAKKTKKARTIVVKKEL